jgi:hypothetical protein
MTSPSKNKGNNFERELVRSAQAQGLDAERAWGSDGHSLGLPAEVDCLIHGLRVQAKRRRSLPAYLTLALHNVDVCAFREDRGDTMALIRWSDLLSLLRSGGGL